MTEELHVSHLGSVVQRPARSRLRALTTACLVAGMPMALVPITASPAAAQSCAQSGSPVVCTFDHTGAAQTFTVPSGVTHVSVDARGPPEVPGPATSILVGPEAPAARSSAT